ncbi:ribokinase [Oceanobacillus sojae]|uniref:ribokinase n=1 Tax=Oceanobacillus sojae TaxID=582851 RepID=UPI0021A73066|nr:ribokinase [Oceanobacillus sojae]MCT1901971.1 ribokinase [Oceanobacillus sojae]
MRKILIVGSLNIDFISNVFDFPKVGETIRATDFHISPGGKGANQAVAAAKLGGHVEMIGKVGGDKYGDVLIESLTKEGVRTQNIKKEGDTGRTFINVDRKGDNTITYVPGANEKITKKDINAWLPELRESSYLLLQQEIQEEIVEYILDLASDLNGCEVILNAAPARFINDKIIQGVHTLIVNEVELEYLSKDCVREEQSLISRVNYLLDKGIKKIIITLGAKGAVFANGSEYKHIPALTVSATDTTGAGDTFIGAYAVAKSEGLNDIEAIKFAVKASAIAVTKYGVQSAIPTRKELEEFTKEISSLNR